MTVIVAARTAKEGIVMACDSEITAGWQKTKWNVPKIWTDDHLVLGSSGDCRPSQVIRHFIEWPDRWPDDSAEPIEVERFMVREVWPAMALACEVNGALRIDLETSLVSVECGFLIAWGDILVEVYDDGSIGMPPSGRAAIGSGYAEALGSLGDKGPWTRKDVIEAAKRARISAQGVGGPIFVSSTKDLEVVEVGE